MRYVVATLLAALSLLIAVSATANPIVLENPASNANTNLLNLDNNEFWTLDDIGAQSFEAPADGLISGQMLLYVHGGVSPDVRFQIFEADATGQIDVNRAVFTGPIFTLPASANSFATAEFFELGNAAPIRLTPGATYFFAVSVRDNAVDPSGMIVAPGSDAFGVDRVPGHLELVSISDTVFTYRDSLGNLVESLDVIFSLVFDDLPPACVDSAVFLDSGQSLGADDDVRDVVLGDLDGDGDRDLVTISNGQDRVFFNDGTGVFTPVQSFPFAGGLSGALGDLDADGDLDWLSTGVASNAIRWNDGGGTFTPGPSVGSPQAFDPAITDVDGDGLADVILVGNFGFEVWRNDALAPGSFSLRDSAAIGAVIAAGYGHVAGDLAFVTRSLGGATRALRNDGTGDFFETWQVPEDGQFNYGVALGDLDGDGRTDLVLADGQGSPKRILRGDDFAQFAPLGSLATTRYVREAALGDLDNDGDLDLALVNWGNTFGPGCPFFGCFEPNEIWINDGAGAFDLGQEFGAAASYTLAIGDVDGDADQDIVVGEISAASPAVRATRVWVNQCRTDAPPTAENDAYTTPEDIALDVSAPGVLANDTDADGDTLLAELVSGPTHGTLTFNADGSFLYSPEPNFNGTDQFTYRANDGASSSNVATVTLLVLSVNDPPSGVDDSYMAVEDTTLDVPAPGVLTNDSDADGDPLQALLLTGPAHGLLALDADGAFSYFPDADFAGTDGFTYLAVDQFSATEVASVTIEVAAVNDVPIAFGDTYTTPEDIALDVSAPGVLANDTDADGDTLAAELVTGPLHGALAFNANGSFTYLPEPNFNGTDQFTYRANDGASSSNVATVTLLVLSVNDPPSGVDDSYMAVEDTTLDVPAPGVLANDSDPDGGALTAGLLTGPLHGALALNANGSFSYVPEPDFFGADGFTYLAIDDSGAASAASVALLVAPVDDPPELVTIASDGFESGNFRGGSGWFAPWRRSGDVDVVRANAPHSGARHARLRRGSGYMERRVNLTGVTNAKLRVWVKVNSFEGADRALIRVSATGTGFTTVRTFTAADSDNTYRFHEIDLSSFAMTSTFTIAFDAGMNAAGDRFFVDDVSVVGSR